MIKFLKFLSLLVFIAAVLATRLPRAGTDSLNSDEVLWNDRSYDFLNALITKNYVKTFQKYHPGVPLMWEFSLTSLAMSKLNSTPVENVFKSIEKLHITTQLVLDIWLLFLCVIILFFLSKALGNWWIAVFTLIAFNVEPFYLGNSRILHHDAQISVYVLLALTIVYLNVSKKFNFFQVILASFFLALAALEKSLFIGAFVFSFFVGGFLALLTQGWKRTVYFLLTLLVFSVGFYIALFPALWVAPLDTLKKIFTQSYEVGDEEGHGQIFFGVATRDPGFFFYPVLLVLKSSYFILIGTIVFFCDLLFKLVKGIKNKGTLKLSKIPFYLYITIFYLGYFVVIQYFSKKVDRYIVSLYPFLGFAAVLGWYEFIKKKWYLVVVPLFLFVYSVAIPLFNTFPNYLLYTSPLFVNADVANEIVGQKLFGIGVFDLRDKLVARYGENAKIASSDFGPLATIYPNGTVTNVLVTHPNDYKVMVLGPNKPFPPSLKNEPTLIFYKVDSVYLNGLEFWRIYQKKVLTIDQIKKYE